MGDFAPCFLQLLVTKMHTLLHIPTLKDSCRACVRFLQIAEDMHYKAHQVVFESCCLQGHKGYQLQVHSVPHANKPRTKHVEVSVSSAHEHVQCESMDCLHERLLAMSSGSTQALFRQIHLAALSYCLEEPRRLGTMCPSALLRCKPARTHAPAKTVQSAQVADLQPSNSSFRMRASKLLLIIPLAMPTPVAHATCHMPLLPGPSEPRSRQHHDTSLFSMVPNGFCCPTATTPQSVPGGMANTWPRCTLLQFTPSRSSTLNAKKFVLHLAPCVQYSLLMLGDR